MTDRKPERRVLGKLEGRAAGDAPQKIGGYAAVFNSPATIGDYFIETIAPGAFTNAIANDDVRALFNHDRNFVLGRKSNNTLVLREDDRGLLFEVTPPDTAWARDLQINIGRRDITDCSFNFIAKRESWDETGSMPIRTLLEVELMDVSVVTFAAYDDTSAGLRSLDDWRAKHVIIPRRAPIIGSRLRMRHALREREYVR